MSGKACGEDGGTEREELAADYSVFSQDYELQLVTYKAQLEPVASPAKKPKVQSGSESVIQEVRWGQLSLTWARGCVGSLRG
jgi:hypothetical protein